jgi:hypothetical protein
MYNDQRTLQAHCPAFFRPKKKCKFLANTLHERTFQVQAKQQHSKNTNVIKLFCNADRPPHANRYKATKCVSALSTAQQSDFYHKHTPNDSFKPQ